MRLFTLTLAFAIAGFAQQPRTLRPGAAVRGNIGADESQTYRFHANAGEYIEIRVVQTELDITLGLTAPDGKRITDLNRREEPETENLFWLAAESGDFEVSIHPVVKSKAGAYSIEMELRAPTGKDITCVTAFRSSIIDARAIERDPPNASRTRRLIQKLEESLEDWRKCGDRSWEGWVLNALSVDYIAISQLAKARAASEAAIAIQRETGEMKALATALNVFGSVADNMGDYAAAAHALEESLILREKLGDRRGKGSTLGNLGVHYQRRGDTTRAEEYFNRSLALRREVGDRSGEAVTLGNIAGILRNRGQYAQANQMFLAALEIRRGLGDKRGEAAILNGIGQTYLSLGDAKLAKDYWRQAASVFDRMGDVVSLASTQHFLGATSAGEGNAEEALRYFERALELRRQAGIRSMEAVTLSSMCQSLLTLGRLEDARKAGEQALGIAAENKNEDVAATATFCVGKVALAGANLDKAAKHLEDSARIARATKNVRHLSPSLAALGTLELARGNLEAAAAFAEEALVIDESVRRGLGSPNLRASFRASKSSRLELYIGILMSRHAKDPTAGFDVAALELTETSRARSLAEMLAESRAGGGASLTETQRKQEAELSRRASALQKELFQEKLAAARREEVRRELAAIARETDLFEFQLARATGGAEVLGVKRIQQELLESGAALVEYSLGEKESYAWVVTPAGLKSAVLPARKTIEHAVAAYRKELSARVTALTAGPALARLDALSRQLHHTLVAPLEPSLAGMKSLMIVPDGSLAYLPFETLLGTSRLIERFAISYAPSASTVAALRDRARNRERPAKTLLAYADPAYGAAAKIPPVQSMAERGFDFVQLPNTRAEVAGIQALFKPADTQVFLGTAAKEGGFKSIDASAFRYLHFATHGYFDEEQPSQSGIVFSLNAGGAEDGVLQSAEIMKLKLNADVVTLSACQTGLGKVVAGEGVLGISRAFLYAGAQSLVVSLWNVNDAATADLMKTFYRNLSRGLTRAEALRQAKLGLMKGSSVAWRHPYYWAPFVLSGDAGGN